MVSPPSGSTKKEILKAASVTTQEASRCERIAVIPEKESENFPCRGKRGRRGHDGWHASGGEGGDRPNVGPDGQPVEPSMIDPDVTVDMAKGFDGRLPFWTNG